MNSSNSKKYITENKDVLMKKYKGLLSAYRLSCNKLTNKSHIPYAYYVRHLKKLITLLQFIHQIYRITFNKSIPQINIFDKRTMRIYSEAQMKYDTFMCFSTSIAENHRITSVSDATIIPVAYYNLHSTADTPYVIRFSQTGSGCMEYNERLLYSTILLRCIRLSFKGNKIRFNGEPERKYGNVGDLEYDKYMSVLPSHITLNIPDNPEDSNIPIPFFDDNILGIFNTLNQFHKGFQEDYEIIHDNRAYATQFNNIKGYADDATINTILYTIVNNNNNYNYDKGYYYWFPYNSPLPAISILDTETFITGIHTLQPLQITPKQLQDIIKNYIGVRYPYSRVANSSLHNYITNGVAIGNDAYKRLRYLLHFCSVAIFNTAHHKKTLYVFHGTHRDFHSEDNKDVVLTSFLSCSFTIDVALKYAYEDVKNSGVIYIIEIGDGIDYINFKDDLYQIILQPSLRVVVTNTLEVGGVKYNLCKAYIINKAYVPLLYDTIFKDKYKQYKIKKFRVHHEKPMYPRVIRRYLQAADGDDVGDDVGDAANANTYICLGTQINEDDTQHTYFNVKYTIHQHFISDCYAFFKRNVVEYAIYYDKDGFHTGYKNDDAYEPINVRSREYGRFNYNWDNLFVDSLLLNDDALYPQSYMKNVRKRFDYKLYSLRNVGLFDYEGYKKASFNIHKPSLKYIEILKEYISRNEDINDLYIRDITRDYMKLIIRGAIDDFRVFKDTFVDMLRGNYIDFIENCMKIDKTTEEYKDLIEMMNELTVGFKTTAEYYVENMENGVIYDEVASVIYDDSVKSAKTGGLHKTATVKAAKTVVKDKEAIPDNKGYCMPYEDFMKVIHKYQENKK